MLRGSICKKCRRAGEKLFLKEERCFTPKCAMVKKPYPPGMRVKKHRSALSEYGLQLREKQNARKIYNISEKQFKRYFVEASKVKGKVPDMLLQKLETRLDNVLFRLGLTGSRAKARQIVSHGHIILNGKKVTIPSINAKKGDVIEIRKGSMEKAPFKDLENKLKKIEPPLWLTIEKNDANEFRAKVLGMPERSEVNVPFDLAMIIEFYSR
jgi:small subunit ribosomal protein S4